MKTTQLLLTCSTVLLTLLGANAAIDITPSFDNAPAGWVTDRYAPNSFGDIGSFQGRDNVLRVGISSAEGANVRPGSFSSSFYNTQGAKTSLTGGPDSVLSADLYIPASWASQANGSVSVGLWGVMQDNLAAVSGYPILGFSNYDPANNSNARFRWWEDTIGSYTELTVPVLYDQWNSLSIKFTGSAYDFYINGNLVGTDSTANGSIGFKEMILNSYNFSGAGLAGSVAANYEVNWSNTPVPEPSTYLAGALLLLPFGASTIRIMRKKLTA